MRTVSLYAALLTSAALTVGCASDQSVIASAAESHKQLEPAIITDTALAGYVQTLGDRITASAREMVNEGFEHDRIYKQNPEWMFTDVKFHLVNSETLNAFTTGGDHVYLYSELFKSCKNEDEFAAVVAHEFSHIVARHVAKGTDRQYGILGAAALAGVGGYALGGDNRAELATTLGGGALAAGQFIGMGFTRGDESEADQFGYQFYANAGYDPDQFAGFFKTLIAKGLDSSSELTSDHPLLKDRVANAEKWSAQWKQDHPNWKSLMVKEIASTSQFEQYQQRSTSVAKNMPDDKSLAAAKLMLNAFPSCVAPTEQQTQTQARSQLTDIVNQEATKDPPAKDTSNKKKRKKNQDNS